MNKETWSKLAGLLREESNKSFRDHREASMVLNSLSEVCKKMGTKSKDELLCEAAEYGNSLR